METDKSLTLYENSIKTDGYGKDESTFELIMQSEDPILKPIKKIISNKFLWFNSKMMFKLAEDLFFLFFSKKIHLNDRNSISTYCILNFILIDLLIELPSFQNYRKGDRSPRQSINTSINDLAVFMYFIIPGLIKIFETNKSAIILNELYIEYQNLEKEQTQILNSFMTEKEANTYSGLQKQLARVETRKAEVAKNIYLKILENETELRDLLIKGIEEIELFNMYEYAMRVFMYGPFRGTEKGWYLELPLDLKMELSRKFSNTKIINHIMLILGSLKRIAHEKQVEKKSDIPIEPSGIYKGELNQDTMPDQLAKLAGTQYTRLDFYKDLINESLDNQERDPIITKDNFGKGSIIACIDTSGSMQGEKEVQSKALAITIADIAYSQKRNFSCILFSSKDDIKRIDIAPDEEAKSFSEKIYQIGTIFFNGGTDFETPLSESLKIIEEDEFKHADIVFLTDGYSEFSLEFLKSYKEKKTSKKFNTYGILFDSSDINRKTGEWILGTFCDKIFFHGDIHSEIMQYKGLENITGTISYMI